MKNYSKLLILPAFAALFSISSCGSDRETGNEQAQKDEVVDSNYLENNRVDTSVTGVPGNTNAVNSEGNAGNGSGMGSSSMTEAEKKH